MSQRTRGRETRSQRRVVGVGAWVQVREVVRGAGLVGERSGGGKEEGWLRVETMVTGGAGVIGMVAARGMMEGICSAFRRVGWASPDWAMCADFCRGILIHTTYTKHIPI